MAKPEPKRPRVNISNLKIGDTIGLMYRTRMALNAASLPGARKLRDRFRNTSELPSFDEAVKICMEYVDLVTDLTEERNMRDDETATEYVRRVHG